MKVYYELYDNNGENLLSSKGKGFIAPIGTQILFYEENKNAIIDCSAIVKSYQYDIESDKVHIICLFEGEIHERFYEEIKLYHGS